MRKIRTSSPQRRTRKVKVQPQTKPLLSSESSSRFKQGRYILKHPEKYIGDPNNIIFRSSWELKCHEFCDNNLSVIEWASEPFFIMYYNPLKKRQSRYFPDYWIKLQKPEGIQEMVVEIKPISQMRTPRKKSKTNLYEQFSSIVNHAKWIAAKEWCRERGLGFSILTEKGMYYPVLTESGLSFSVDSKMMM